MAKEANKTTLAKARRQGKLEQFIREHEKDAPGDLEKLDRALKRPDKSKETRKASPQDASDD